MANLNVISKLPMMKKNRLLESVMLPKKQGPFQQLHSPLHIQVLQVYPSADAVINSHGLPGADILGCLQNVTRVCQPYASWAAG